MWDVFKSKRKKNVTLFLKDVYIVPNIFFYGKNKSVFVGRKTWKTLIGAAIGLRCCVFIPVLVRGHHCFVCSTALWVLETSFLYCRSGGHSGIIRESTTKPTIKIVLPSFGLFYFFWMESQYCRRASASKRCCCILAGGIKGFGIRIACTGFWASVAASQMHKWVMETIGGGWHRARLECSRGRALVDRYWLSWCVLCHLQSSLVPPWLLSVQTVSTETPAARPACTFQESVS